MHKSMKVKIHKTKDFYAGLMFIFFGSYTVLTALSYPMGTTSRMGPGYFPTVLGGGLIMLGLICVAQALWFRRERIESWSLRPLILVLSSVVLFSFLINPLGLVIATLALVFISSMGGWEFRLKEVLALYIVLGALAIGIFVYGLRLPFKVWPI